MALISLKIASILDRGLFAAGAEGEASVQLSAPIEEVLSGQASYLVVILSSVKLELQSIQNPFVGYIALHLLKPLVLGPQMSHSPARTSGRVTRLLMAHPICAIVHLAAVSLVVSIWTLFVRLYA